MLNSLINTCENLFPGYRVFSCSDFKVLKGIIFKEDLAKTHIIQLQEIYKDNHYEIDISAKVWSKNFAGKIHYHFSAKVKLLRKIPIAPIYDSTNLNQDKIICSTGKDFYQTWIGSLFHGSSFWGVQKVLNINSEKVTTECVWQEIEEKQQGQFPVAWFNPYTTDISMHGQGIWLQHLHQEGSLPGQVEKYEQFIPTPRNKPFYVSCEVRHPQRSWWLDECDRPKGGWTSLKMSVFS